MCFSKEALSSPLTTLPSQALQTEAVKLFKVPPRSRRRIFVSLFGCQTSAIRLDSANATDVASSKPPSRSSDVSTVHQRGHRCSSYRLPCVTGPKCFAGLFDSP